MNYGIRLLALKFETNPLVPISERRFALNLTTSHFKGSPDSGPSPETFTELLVSQLESSLPGSGNISQRYCRPFAFEP